MDLSESTLSHQLFTFHRKNYLEECYFGFSYSLVPDDEGRVGAVLTNALDMTETPTVPGQVAFRLA